MLRVSHHCLLMATSPHPNASPSAVSPAPSPPPPPSTTITGSPPQSFFSPPLGTPATSPVPQSNANPPGPTTPSVPSPPTQSPLSTPSSPPPSPPLASPPPPLSSADPPSNSTSPPPTPISASPPISPPPRATPSSPTPPAQSSPPPVPSTPPTLGSPPPPLAQPIQRSPPPPSPTPPKRPPSPPSTSSPENSPPSVSPNPPLSSTPPPPSPKPPETSPPPPTLSQPPSNSPPPPASEASPKGSPPPPASEASPKGSPPPPASEASPKRSPPSPTTAAPILKNAPLPPRVALPNPPASQPTPPLSNSTPKASFPSSVINLAPPPYSPFSPPSSVNDTIPSAPENSKSIGNGGIATGGMVAILVALSVVMISLIGFGVWCIRKQRKDVTGFNGGYAMPSPLGSSPRSDSIFTKTTARLMGSGSSSDFVYTPPDPGSLGNSRSWFTYEELLKATNGFSSQNLLGKGGFGCVYYGRLPDGREVAVKQLNTGGGQGEREFKAEVEIISRIHHRHLVSLVGYCITKKRRLLIYDYLPNNTLYFHLGGEGRPVLDWATRVKIAAGAARGIAYLHEDCHPRIIHRDVKSSNILLDKNFEAKVSDFGLAKLAFDSNTHITTRVMGTFGYVAPEYASSGKLTEKSDVFSYGVVLLELITGRKPVDPSQPVGDESLVEWARPLLSHALDSKEFDALVDPRLEKNYVESEMFQMIEAAAACVRHSATKRPWMGQVVRAFDNLTTADITNGLRFGESEVVNSAQQSAEIRLFQRMAFGSQNYSTKFFSQGSSSSQG